MSVSKYAKYFTPLPLDHGRGGEVVGRFVGAKDFEGHLSTLSGIQSRFSKNLM
jgi:hypothetical protein